MESNHPAIAGAGDRSPPGAAEAAGHVGIPSAAAAYLVQRRIQGMRGRCTEPIVSSAHLTHSADSSEWVCALGCLEALTPALLPDLEPFLAETARFRDPCHDVTGRAAVLRVLERMFTDLRDVRFTVEAAAGRPELCYARWRFFARLARAGRPALEFPRISEIEFDAAGRMTSHFDFWDPTVAVFDHVPLLGFVLRRLKRRIGGG